MLKSKIAIIISTLLLSFFISQPAQAQGVTSIEGALCKGYGVVAGPAGRATAIIFIAILALTVFLGKASWGLGLAFAVGVGLLFGAASLVKFITGSDTTTCSNDGTLNEASTF